MVQVQAQGFDVRYEILSPVPCPLFSIGRGEGRGGRALRGCLCGWFRGDLHYLTALLRNEAGAQAENWGEVAFGDQASVTAQPWKWTREAALRALPRQRIELGRWEPGGARGGAQLCVSLPPADGVIRTTAPLELAPAEGAAVTALQVKAFERLRPWASAELDLTVNVRPVNRWPPRCLPALLL